MFKLDEYIDDPGNNWSGGQTLGRIKILITHKNFRQILQENC